MTLSRAIGWDAMRANTARAFQYRDFRLLWYGALFSFLGSWVQIVAQGWYVYEITGDRSKLAFLSFIGMVPMAVAGPIAGAITDATNRRRLLVGCQIVYAVTAIFIAAAIYWKFAVYWQFLVVSFINGIINTVETPTRQSLVSTIVPPEDLAAAVPLNAMTFNISRIAGSALGALLLGAFGPALCFLLNGLSFLALIFAVVGIRVDISRQALNSTGPILPFVLEGIRYTWHDIRLRTIFLMEVTMSLFGLMYLPLLPAIAKDHLHMRESGLGLLYTWQGVGALTALVSLTLLGDRPVKAFLLRSAMSAFGIGLALLAIVPSGWVAYPVMALLGCSGVMQFNITNTMFQLMSPPPLRGRLLAMHVWALSGAGIVLLPAFGWLAHNSGIRPTLLIGSLGVVGGAGLSWIYRQRVQDNNLGSIALRTST